MKCSLTPIYISEFLCLSHKTLHHINDNLAIKKTYTVSDTFLSSISGYNVSVSTTIFNPRSNQYLKCLRIEHQQNLKTKSFSKPNCKYFNR